MTDEKRVSESFTKSHLPAETIRSFTGGPSEPTPLPADTPFAISTDGGAGTAADSTSGDAGTGAGPSGGDAGSASSDSD